MNWPERLRTETASGWANWAVAVLSRAQARRIAQAYGGIDLLFLRGRFRRLALRGLAFGCLAFRFRRSGFGIASGSCFAVGSRGARRGGILFGRFFVFITAIIGRVEAAALKD